MYRQHQLVFPDHTQVFSSNEFDINRIVSESVDFAVFFGNALGNDEVGLDETVAFGDFLLILRQPLAGRKQGDRQGDEYHRGKDQTDGDDEIGPL